MSPGSKSSGYLSGAGGRTGRVLSGGRGGWSGTGGPGRDHSVLMEVEVDKVTCTYTYSFTTTFQSPQYMV